MKDITRQTVLDYIAANPGDTNKRDIAKGWGLAVKRAGTSA